MAKMTRHFFSNLALFSTCVISQFKFWPMELRWSPIKPWWLGQLRRYFLIQQIVVFQQAVVQIPLGTYAWYCNGPATSLIAPLINIKQQHSFGAIFQGADSNFLSLTHCSNISNTCIYEKKNYNKVKWPMKKNGLTVVNLSCLAFNFVQYSDVWYSVSTLM